MSSIGEYAADAMDEANLRYAGSVDSGATDTEYTHPPYYTPQRVLDYVSNSGAFLNVADNPPYAHQTERLVLETGTPGVVARTHICAADERMTALQEQLDALRKTVATQDADFASAYTDLSQRINAVMLESTLETRVAHLEAMLHAHVNEAHEVIPQIRRDDTDPPLRTLPATAAARLAELEAKWASVPWESIRKMHTAAGVIASGNPHTTWTPHIDAVGHFLEAQAAE